MKKASEYRQHAAECRAIAAGMSLGEHRDQLLAMAAKWEELARDRETIGEPPPRLGRRGLDGAGLDGE
jgi:hypothetical protein